MPKKIIDLDALSEFKQKCDQAYSGGSSLPTGGTTGQVLAKKSDTDNDVEWSDYATQVVSNGRLIKILTNPSSYSTVTGGFKPTYRVARSAFTVNTTNISDPQIGDLVYYSSYYYYIGYVDTNYVYLSARVSIVGPAGAVGKNGAMYATSVAPSGSGPWTFATSNLSPTYVSGTANNFLIYYNGYFYAATSASTSSVLCNTRYLIPTDTPTTLAGLTDTLISSPSDGQTLVWDATAQAWKNGNAGGGGKKYLASFTLTSNETTFEAALANCYISSFGVVELGTQTPLSLTWAEFLALTKSDEVFGNLYEITYANGGDEYLDTADVRITPYDSNTGTYRTDFLIADANGNNLGYMTMQLASIQSSTGLIFRPASSGGGGGSSNEIVISFQQPPAQYVSGTVVSGIAVVGGICKFQYQGMTTAGLIDFVDNYGTFYVTICSPTDPAFMYRAQIDTSLDPNAMIGTWRQIVLQ